MYDSESGSSSGSGSGSGSECVHYTALCNGISDCSSDFDETIGVCDGKQKYS